MTGEVTLAREKYVLNDGGSLTHLNPFRAPKSLPILDSNKYVKKRVSSSKGILPKIVGMAFFL